MRRYNVVMNHIIVIILFSLNYINMARGHKRSHRRRSHRHRRRSCRYRGGAATIPTPGPAVSTGSPAPGSYSDSASYELAVAGNGQQQFNGVFGPGSSGQSNAIVGLQGQHAGSRKKRGGVFGQVLSQAAVPLSLLAMQQSYRRRSNKSRRYSRRR